MTHNLYELTFPPSFFENEVREGFFVCGMMKRFWASQLTIVSEIAKICHRHGIPWFAACGTLLGAVRHGGFIPWDDDLDIVMKRDDLQRFLEIAPDELPEGYTAYDVQTQSWYRNSIAHVGNSESISIDNMKQFHGCPYAAGVDIFALDGIYRNPEQEADRRERFVALKEAEVLLVEEGADAKAVQSLLQTIEQKQGIRLKRDKDLQGHLLAQMVKLFREVALTDTENGLGEKCEMFSQIYDRLVFHTSDFDDMLWMPFEHTVLPVPAKYDAVLRAHYGDYMRIGKGGAAHTYPVYETQEEILQKHIGGMHPFRYTFRRDHLSAERHPFEKDRKIRELLEQTKAQMEAAISAGHPELAEKLLAAAKKLTTQKTVLFLPVKADWWNTMEAMYRAHLLEESTQVFVRCIPRYERNYDLSTGTRHDDTLLFPEALDVKPATEDELRNLQPDIIYVQYPFDGEDQAGTIDAAFFTSRLRNYTKCLVYIPPFVISGKDKESETARKALSYLVEQPAVVYADKVVLPDEDIRHFYVQHMTELAGTDTSALWEEKMTTVQ